MKSIVNGLNDIKGIGPKVLDCILLYGLHDLSVFPMDVWIKRAINKNYRDLIDGIKSYEKISNKMRNYFGKYAGYAQLFIYNYIRSDKFIE